MAELPVTSPPFSVSTSESIWTRMRCFIHNFVYEASLPNEIIEVGGFFRSQSATHFTKSYLINNPNDSHAFNQAKLDSHPSLARIDISISTENFVTSYLSGPPRPTSNDGPTNSSAAQERRYNFVVSAKAYDSQNNEFSEVHSRTDKRLPVLLREVRGWVGPAESADMAPLLGRFFDWPCFVELLKFDALVKTKPAGFQVDDPLKHMGILGYGTGFRPALKTDLGT